MGRFIKIPTNTKLPPFYVLKKRRGIFWSIYLLPTLSVIAASVLYRPHWAYTFSLFWTFFVLLFLIDCFERRRLEDNWGLFERDTKPVRFWVHVSIWILFWGFASLWPIGFAIQEAQK